MRLPLKFLIFCFFSKFFLLKTPKRPPSIFWNFASEWMLKNLKGSPLSQFPALWHFSNGIIFVLKLGFLRSGTLYPIFVVLKDRCFSIRLLKKFVSLKPLLNFCQKRNVLRELRTPQGFRHYATYRRPSKIFSKNFFLNFLFKGFSLRKMGFCCFQLGKNGFRDLCVFFRVFFLTLYIVKLMKFYCPFTLGSYDIAYMVFASVCEARLRLC